MSDETIILRPAVTEFAQRMEVRLRLNDYKKGWEDCDPDDLFDMMEEEIAELSYAMFGSCPKCGNQDYRREDAYFDEDAESVKDEAADVANFAMMIADNWEAPDE